MMAQFSVTIPDNKTAFFRELLRSLHFAKFEQAEEMQLAETHKAILDQRLETYKSNPATYLAWEAVAKDIERRL